ncbi:hypothetical protein J6TS1_27620 [Siminovitchia terrae]|uniref:Uncharacterized protein n=1 Tax=Siminovitchia terrae TaxID=1914933 RepID=A0ABQ4L006_SIMTE|nr:hypothetical protein [Siminovitchia terrae]GIN96892.1 hypothetical protein J6TS1_27620 [Siminovitchia terrae]
MISLAKKSIGHLQHYNPLIDNEVKETWKILEAWILMPFGGIESKPNEKEFIPGDERIKIFS